MIDKKVRLDKQVQQADQTVNRHAQQVSETEHLHQTKQESRTASARQRVQMTEDEQGLTLCINMGWRGFYHGLNLLLVLMFLFFYFLVQFGLYMTDFIFAFYTGWIILLCLVLLMYLYAGRPFNIFVSPNKQFNVYRRNFNRSLAVGRLSGKENTGLQLDVRELFPYTDPVYKRLIIFVENRDEDTIEEIVEIAYLSVRDIQVIESFMHQIG